jgi:OOP family OmpA-OmpF porin
MKTMILCMTLTFISPFILSQTEKVRANYSNSLSGAVGLTAEGGITLGFTDYESSKIDYVGNVSFDYFFPSSSKGIFGFRIIGKKGIVAGKDPNKIPNEFSTKIDYLGGSFVYALSLNESVYPYLSVGAANLWFYPRDNNGNKLPGYAAGAYKTNMLVYNGELGLRVMLSDNISWNINGGVVVSDGDNLDDIKQGPNNDLFYTVTTGLTFYIGRGEDTDEDGVDDSKDMCPGTPPGVKVDEFGCPLDSDNDGVPDYLDKCSNTPNGVKVDREGCPLDSDGDGVPDYLDKCINTPTGVSVDANGCPLDTDEDGVPDYLDKCPKTPKGTEVDSTGCPVKIEVVKTKIKKIVLSGDTNFEFDKAALLPNAYPVLDSLAVTMKENPDFKWVIEGHTDAIGSASYNMELSRRRAQAVVDYLVSKGVDKSNLQVVPYGESEPIATNKTQEGRAMNRRVEIKVTEENK